MFGYYPRGKFAAKGMWAIGGIIFTLVFVFIFAVIVMLLWNWLMPVIFGLPLINYWQAWGLLLLSHILIKGHGFKYGGPYQDARWKEKFRDRMHERMWDCHMGHEQEDVSESKD